MFYLVFGVSLKLNKLSEIKTCTLSNSVESIVLHQGLYGLIFNCIMIQLCQQNLSTLNAVLLHADHGEGFFV